MALGVSLTYTKIYSKVGRLAKFGYRGSRDSMSNMIAIVFASLLEASFQELSAKKSNTKLDTNCLGDALRWWLRRRSLLGMFKVFSIWLGHTSTWASVARVNVKPQDDGTTPGRNSSRLSLPIWYWGGTRSIWKLIKQVFHQVLIDLNRTPDGWVMAFLIKYCWVVDEPNVGLRWTCTPRLVLCMVYPCPICCRGHKNRPLLITDWITWWNILQL